MAVVLEAKDHPTAAEIYDRVKSRLPGIAYGTIYNSLAMLVEQGAVVRWNYGDAATRYEARTDAHTHVYCVRCSRLVDVDIAQPAAQLHLVEDQSGFKVLGHHTEFVGLCQTCIDKDPQPKEG